MIRILLFLFIVYVVGVISALADCLGGEHPPRHLPRFAWSIAIVVLPYAGAVLWFVYGRPRAPHDLDAEPPPPPRTTPAPDDDPAFLAELARRLRKRENGEK